MNPSKTYRLSKTTYCKGLNCAKSLWLHFHKPEVATKVSAYKQRLFDFGHGVGKRATEGFPGGVLIDIPREEQERALLETKNALALNPPAIFEGAFLFNEVIVRVDILKNNQDGSWDLMEVKSSKLKPNPHYDDLAIQKWVLIGSGVQIKNSYLMSPVRGFIPDTILDPSQNFVLHKLDIEISQNLEKVEDVLLKLNKNLNSNEPTVPRGDHCNSPYECEFKKYCKKKS